MPEHSRRIVILGSTGSIGRQTLDVVDRLRQAGRELEIVGLAAGRNIELLEAQIASFAPRVVSVASAEAAENLEEKHPEVRVLHGDEGLLELSQLDDADTVVNALVGAVGLAPTLAALSIGRKVALANKESLVVGGDLVRAELERSNGRLFPLDSEHSALLQCLGAGRREDVAHVILTASGGPFRETDLEALSDVTPREALAHPNWTMGSRITIDSATMVNKAFEVIEAHHLFEVSYNRIDVVVHPESIVHAVVHYNDGSVIAQLAAHDMRIPIQYALTFPERIPTDLPHLDLGTLSKLTFEPLVRERFPAFDVVLSSASAGGSAPAAINAADEILISRFLEGQIPFLGIARGLAAVLDRWTTEADRSAATLDLILQTDRWARTVAADLPVE